MVLQNPIHFLPRVRHVWTVVNAHTSRNAGALSVGVTKAVAILVDLVGDAGKLESVSVKPFDPKN